MSHGAHYQNQAFLRQYSERNAIYLIFLTVPKILAAVTRVGPSVSVINCYQYSAGARALTLTRLMGGRLEQDGICPAVWAVCAVYCGLLQWNATQSATVTGAGHSFASLLPRRLGRTDPHSGHPPVLRRPSSAALFSATVLLGHLPVCCTASLWSLASLVKQGSPFT